MRNRLFFRHAVGRLSQFVLFFKNLFQMDYPNLLNDPLVWLSLGVSGEHLCCLSTDALQTLARHLASSPRLKALGPVSAPPDERGLDLARAFLKVAAPSDKPIMVVASPDMEKLLQEVRGQEK